MKKIAAILALALGISALPALAQQDAGGPPPGQGGPGGFGGGGPGGGFGGGPGGGGFGGGNFDPAQFQAQMQQTMMDRYHTGLEITNDTDWAVIQPLIQKVLDARQALTSFGGGPGGPGGFGGRPGGPGGPGGGPGGQTASVEQQALQSAIDNNSPTAQIKAALEKYKAAQKIKQAALTAAQEALLQVLSTKQEAQATLLGLLS